MRSRRNKLDGDDKTSRHDNMTSKRKRTSTHLLLRSSLLGLLGGGLLGGSRLCGGCLLLRCRLLLGGLTPFEIRQAENVSDTIMRKTAINDAG